VLLPAKPKTAHHGPVCSKKLLQTSTNALTGLILRTDLLRNCLDARRQSVPLTGKPLG
jgi:hypothetical protein